MIRAYHASRKDFERTETITTMFSHPCDAAGPGDGGLQGGHHHAGQGRLRRHRRVQGRALSTRTAAIFITNPEDTGIYNPRIDEFVRAAHEAGALCYYDQANANGMLGITRARDAGFDLCHFNLHKTFSVPHGSMGGAVGALGCTDAPRQVPAHTSGQAGQEEEAYYLRLRHRREHRKGQVVHGEHPEPGEGLLVDNAARRGGPPRRRRSAPSSTTTT